LLDLLKKHVFRLLLLAPHILKVLEEVVDAGGLLYGHPHLGTLPKDVNDAPVGFFAALDLRGEGKVERLLAFVQVHVVH